MSEIEPNAPPGFVWCFLEIDIPVCRDFVLHEEQRTRCAMTNDAAIEFLRAEFSFNHNRAKQIVDTIKGEIV